MHPIFNPVAPYQYLIPTIYVSVADIANLELLECSCRIWISLDITHFYERQCLPSRGRMACAQKCKLGLHCRAEGVDAVCTSACQTTVTAPSRVGCVIWVTHWSLSGYFVCFCSLYMSVIHFYTNGNFMLNCLPFNFLITVLKIDLSDRFCHLLKDNNLYLCLYDNFINNTIYNY